MIDDIAEKIHRGERVSNADALRLFAHPNVVELGMLADVVRRRKWPADRVTYNIGRNINYTNVCWVKCDSAPFIARPVRTRATWCPKNKFSKKLTPSSRWAATRQRAARF